MKQLFVVVFFVFGCIIAASGQQLGQFNGLHMNMGNLFLLSDAQTRSISPENPTGEKGRGGMTTLANGTAASAARDLGQGWKVNPFIRIQPGQVDTLALIQGPGAIQHIWMTATGYWRFEILRIYWDDEKNPVGGSAAGRFLLHGLEPLCTAPITGRMCESR